MDGLPLFHRIAGQPVLLVGRGSAAEARRRLITEAGGHVVTEVGSGVRLAFVAFDEEDSADIAGMATSLREKGLLVHVADRPDLCDFYLPAIVDRSPVLVAIGTAGASASLAKALKERLEIILPSTLGRLAQAIYASRAAVKRKLPTIAGRREFWAAMLAPGGPLDPLANLADPDAAIAADLAEPEGNPAITAIIRIRLPAPPPDGTFDTGELRLSTLRALAQADLVIHDADVPEAVLAFIRRDADRRIGNSVPPDARGRIVLMEMAPTS